MKQRRDTLGTPRGEKEREPVPRFPLKKCLFMWFQLAEVALQQALESLTVAGPPPPGGPPGGARPRAAFWGVAEGDIGRFKPTKKGLFLKGSGERVPLFFSSRGPAGVPPRFSLSLT